MKIRKEEDDWFLFPSENKEGRRLQKIIKLEGDGYRGNGRKELTRKVLWRSSRFHDFV